MHDFRCKKVNRKQMQNLLGGYVKIPGGGLMMVGGGMEKTRAKKTQTRQRCHRRMLKALWMACLTWSRKRQVC